MVCVVNWAANMQLRFSAFEMGRWNSQAFKTKHNLMFPGVENTTWKDRINRSQ